MHILCRKKKGKKKNSVLNCRSSFKISFLPLTPLTKKRKCHDIQMITFLAEITNSNFEFISCLLLSFLALIQIQTRIRRVLS